MLEASSLSLAALGLRARLAAAAGLAENQVVIGPPQTVSKRQEEAPDRDYLALFFYRVDHAAYPADGGAGEQCFAQAHCLITAMAGNRSSDGPGPGEVELQLMGAVLARLHANPTLTLLDAYSGEAVAQLQVVPLTLSLDDINHLWASQTNIPYRLSACYELALLPVPLAPAGRKNPLVAVVAGSAYPGVGSAERTAPGDASPARVPAVPRVAVATGRDDWVPHLCLLEQGGGTAYTARLAHGTTKVKIIPLGAPGALLDLEWQIWERDGARIWRELPVAATQKAVGNVLDPGLAAQQLLQLSAEVDCPLAAPGQALLRVRRDWAGSDGVVTLRSNPVLVTLE